MEVRVLGAFEVTIGRISIVPTAAKPRTLLALLVLRAGHVVPVAELIAELWGDDPPRTAEATLQSYISRLRKVFEGCLPGCDPKLLLRTERGGYLLNIPTIRVDAVEFERHAAAGLQSFAEQDLGEADGRFRAALDLWSGRTLDGVSVGLWLADEVGRLERVRVAVQRYRAECARPGAGEPTGAHGAARPARRNGPAAPAADGRPGSGTGASPIATDASQTAARPASPGGTAAPDLTAGPASPDGTAASDLTARPASPGGTTAPHVATGPGAAPGAGGPGWSSRPGRGRGDPQAARGRVEAQAARGRVEAQAARGRVEAQAGPAGHRQSRPCCH